MFTLHFKIYLVNDDVLIKSIGDNKINKLNHVYEFTEKVTVENHFLKFKVSLQSKSHIQFNRQPCNNRVK